MARKENSGGVPIIFPLMGWGATILGLVSAGYLSLRQAEFALIALVVLVSLASALRISLARTVLGVGLPCVAVALFVIRESGGDSSRVGSLAGWFGALVVAMLAIVFMVRGFFR